MLLELVQGVALLLALCFLYSVNIRLLRRQPTLQQLLSGLLFGAICVVGMLKPLQLAPGVIIDARSVVLSMAALFGGPWAAAISTAMAAAMRLALGGAGVGIGLLVIVWCSAAGLAYRHALRRGRVHARPLALLAFGLLLHLSVLGMFQGLEPAAVARVNSQLALPYLLVFGPATMFLGWLLQDVQRRLHTESALADSVARLQAITQSIPDPVLVIDDQGHYLEILSPDETQLIAPAADLLGKRVTDVLPADLAERVMGHIRDCLRTGKPASFTYQLQALGGPSHFEGRCQPLATLVHGRQAVVLLVHDRTEYVQAEAALQESEQRLRTLLRDIPSISVQGYLADGTVTYWNKASEQLYGYLANEALGQSIFDLIVPPAAQADARNDVAQMFATGMPTPACELHLRHKNGAGVDVFSSHAYVHVPGRPPELFCLDVDISSRKAAEERARYLALYDALTGLPNRRLLRDRLEQVLSGNLRTNQCAAVLQLDLDHFKTLNDSQGHVAGDQLLVEVARRLQASVQADDTVARLGGDEFVVLLHNLGTDPFQAAAQVRALGDKILQRLRQPCQLGAQEHHSTASMGATMVHAAPCSAEELLKQADLALYRAKEEGRNTLRFFDPVMQAAVNQRLQLQAELHKALRQGELALFYQPQVDAQGRIVGAEALLRWHHPEKGLVAPGLFIPLAEETGQILALGRWVLETALRQQGQWRQDPVLAALNLSINVSARQFRQAEFVAELRELLLASGADPRRIKLELTESLLLQDVEQVIAIMQALRSLGLGLSLDDFGTGYSSLGYLKRLPLDQVKIDQGFVRGMLQDEKDAAIAHSIIALAHRLGLGVVAEGVETEAHHRFLLAQGCRDFQGYLFGRPEPLADFEQRAKATA